MPSRAVSFLFWNLNKKPLQDRITRLVHCHEIDVLMLAECEIGSQLLIEIVRSGSGRDFIVPGNQGGKVRILVRSPGITLVDKSDDDDGRLTIRRLEVDGSAEVLLSVVHFPSRVNRDRAGLNLELTRRAGLIARSEDEVGHRRTVLVGDLNLNPFDDGVVSAHGLHAISTRAKASESHRVINGAKYPFFYNPMWGHFGDRTTGPPGTYYLSSSDSINYFWNIYDQVLLRPGLADCLSELRILDHDGQESLLSENGLPHRASASDHLPIFFRLNLE